jgi:hypothetical protein
MNRIPLILVPLAIVAVLLPLVACSGAEARDEAAPEVELRVYQVPEAYKNEIWRQLRDALETSSESPVGRVARGPRDTLLVTAPANIQENVEQLLHDLAELGDPPPPEPVVLSYWMVLGRPGNETGPPLTNAGRTNLDAIEPALREIVSTDGPTEFLLIDQIRLASMGGDRSAASGSEAQVEQRTAVRNGRIVAELQLTLHGNRMETQVVLEPRQLLVLGHAGYRGPMPHAFEDDEDSYVTLYYVVTGETGEL